MTKTRKLLIVLAVLGALSAGTAYAQDLGGLAESCCPFC